MKFSYDWIQELGGIKMEPQQAADILTAKAFEIEGISEAVGQKIFDAKILPNRPDCLSHLGVARELCALTGKHFIAPAYEYRISARPTFSVIAEDTEACPRYSGLIVRGVRIGPSPQWLSDRLVACGMKSINNVVDATNYVMLELGQPMHAFDLATIDRIVVRHARLGEKLQAIDEARTEYELQPSMLVIANGEHPVAIAGIKGDASAGISNATSEILLEAANFQPQSIRATSRALGLHTDASTRFSYGVDPNLTAAALMRAAELLRDLAHGNPDPEIIDAYPSPRRAREVFLHPNYVQGLLGVSVSGIQIRSILQSLGCDVSQSGEALLVTVPTRRLDITSQEDLIEEVGRVYGYEAIPSRAPVLPIFDETQWVREDDAGVAWDEYSFVRERLVYTRMLAGTGYSEAYSYSFISDELKELYYPEVSLGELARPQSSEYRWLRRSLIPRLLMHARDNLRFVDEVKLFETGHVFDHVDDGKESVRLGMVLARKSSKNDLFYELKGAIDVLLKHARITNYYYDDVDPFDWDSGVARVVAKGQRALIRTEETGQIIGCIGAASPRIAEALKLKGSAAIAELDLRLLVQLAQGEREFEPLPKYPSMVRDIAVLVDRTVKVDDLLEIIDAADTTHLVRDVDVFDIYEPAPSEDASTQSQQKSVAFHITYRSDDHTLTDEEVAVVEDAIKAFLKEKIGAQIR